MKITFYIVLITAFVISCTKPHRQSGQAVDILSEKVYYQVQSTYTDFSKFEKGTSIVLKNKKYGLIFQDGKEILKCEYDTIMNLRYGLRVICKDKKFGIVNIDGEILLDCAYDNIATNYERYIPLKLNKKWGFVDLEGNSKINFKYDEYIYMDENLILLKENGEYGAIDYDENIIFDFEYDEILYDLFSDGITFLKKNNKYGIANSSNQVITDCIYDNFSKVSNGYINLSKGYSSNKKTVRHGMVNASTGEEVIPFTYNDLGIYNEGLILACKGDKYGYIDINNNTIIPFEYDDARQFSEGLAMVAKYKGRINTEYGAVKSLKTGFIDKKGELSIPFNFGNQLFVNPIFKEGLAPIGVNDGNMFASKFGYIDKTGSFVIQPIFTEAGVFSHGLAEVEIQGKIGFVDRQGNFAIQCIYDGREYEYGLGDSIICLKKNDVKFYFDYFGEKIKKPYS